MMWDDPISPVPEQELTPFARDILRQHQKRYDAPDEMLITTEGCRVIGRDRLPTGEVSCLKQNLGDCESPEHAEVMACIWNSSYYLTLLLLGQITPKMIDAMAAKLQAQRAERTPCAANPCP